MRRLLWALGAICVAEYSLSDPVIAGPELLMNLPQGYELQTESNDSRLLQQVYVDVMAKNRITVSQFRVEMSAQEILESFKGSSRSGRCKVLEETTHDQHQLKTSGLDSRRHRIVFECPLFSRSGILEVIEVKGHQSLVLRTESQSPRLGGAERNQWGAWLDQQVQVCSSQHVSLCEREQMLRAKSQNRAKLEKLNSQDLFYYRKSLQWGQKNAKYRVKQCQKAEPGLLRNIKRVLEDPSKEKERVCFQYQEAESPISYHCLPLDMVGPEIQYTFASDLSSCEQHYTRNRESFLSAQRLNSKASD